MTRKVCIIDIDSGFKICSASTTDLISKSLTFPHLIQKLENTINGTDDAKPKDVGDETKIELNLDRINELSLVKPAENIYSNRDAIKDLKRNEEDIYVFENDEITRVYSKTYLSLDENESKDMICYRIDDTQSLRAAKRTNVNLKKYLEAYYLEDIKNPKEKALTHGMKKIARNKLNPRVNIIYSTVFPSNNSYQHAINKIEPNFNNKINTNREE